MLPPPPYQTMVTSSPSNQTKRFLLSNSNYFDQTTGEFQDSSTSNILYSSDPDINCFAELKQVSIETCAYFNESEYKDLIDIHLTKSDFSLIYINIRS